MIAEDARVAVDELFRLRRLASRLLLLASAEGPDFLQVAPVELGELVLECLSRWSHTHRRWSLGVLEEAKVDGDRDRLTLAMEALIENAVDHTGVDDSIELSVRREGTELVLAVADSGSGIAATEGRADLRPVRPRRRWPEPGGRQVRSRPGDREGDRGGPPGVGAGTKLDGPGLGLRAYSTRTHESAHPQAGRPVLSACRGGRWEDSGAINHCSLAEWHLAPSRTGWCPGGINVPYMFKVLRLGRWLAPEAD